MPFAKLAVYHARIPDPQDPTREPPRMKSITFNDDVEAFHWNAPGHPLVEITFHPMDPQDTGKKIQFKAKGMALPLIWFNFSCDPKTCRMVLTASIISL